MGRKEQKMHSEANETDNKTAFGAREIATAAMLLAICIVAQLFKNTSVFITGPVINACLILCELFAGLAPAVVLSIVTPVTSALITGSPVMQAVPLLPLFIMLGNIVLVLCVWLMERLQWNINRNVKTAFGMAGGSVLKSLFMGLTISYGILPNFLPAAMMKMLPVLQAQFSTTQLVTALIGSAIAFVVRIPVGKALKAH